MSYAYTEIHEAAMPLFPLPQKIISTNDAYLLTTNNFTTPH